MSTTVTYKGNTIATLNNQMKRLNTAGTWMEADVVITDESSGGGSSGIVITDTTDAAGGTVRTITAVEISGTKTITQNGTGIDVTEYAAVDVNVSGGGSPSATQHEIHLEFSDGTDTDIDVYYDDALLGTMITAYTPTTYGGKTVTLAQLDGVTWYEPAAIPLNTQLIDFTKVVNDYIIDADGQMFAFQWYSASDYTIIAPNMTFTYTGCYWFYIAFYDSSKTFISSMEVSRDATQDQVNQNIGHGTLSGNKIPSNAAYIRISSVGNPDSSELSFIRTA